MQDVLSTEPVSLSAIVAYTFQWDMGYKVKSTQQTIAYINN